MSHGFPRAAATSIGAVAAAGALAFAWGSLVERKLYTLRRVEIPALAPGAEPIKVLHFSDLHLAPWQRDKIAWVRSLAELEPDLVVDTGDNLGHKDAYGALEEALAPFRGIPGVYVNGSNDYFEPSAKNQMRYFMGPSKSAHSPKRLDTARMERYFDELGWTNLNNDATEFSVRGTPIEFFGVDDPHRQFDRLEVLPGLLDEWREDEHETRLSIALTHAPYQRVLNSFVNHGANVIFAGHTHGGQVCVPGFGALVTNCDIPRDQVKGLSTWQRGLKSAWLNVSAGLGTSIYAPFRFSCLPEASLVTLVAAQ